MSDHTSHAGSMSSASARAAAVLWVVVLIALAYGIFNTGKSVVDLFSG